jgi:hypothetical protein
MPSAVPIRFAGGVECGLDRAVAVRPTKLLHHVDRSLALCVAVGNGQEEILRALLEVGWLLLRLRFCSVTGFVGVCGRRDGGR